MAPNPINRNNVGSTTKGVRNSADGSLTVYISSKKIQRIPSTAPTGSGLKADVPLFLLMRVCKPAPDVLEGKQLLAATLRAEAAS
jgi:hypothetical protein